MGYLSTKNFLRIKMYFCLHFTYLHMYAIQFIRLGYYIVARKCVWLLLFLLFFILSFFLSFLPVFIFRDLTESVVIIVIVIREDSGIINSMRTNSEIAHSRGIVNNNYTYRLNIVYVVLYNNNNYNRMKPPIAAANAVVPNAA